METMGGLDEGRDYWQTRIKETKSQTRIPSLFFSLLLSSSSSPVLSGSLSGPLWPLKESMSAPCVEVERGGVWVGGLDANLLLSASQVYSQGRLWGLYFLIEQDASQEGQASRK